LNWFTRLVASAAFIVVPLDGRAPSSRGQVRGESPHPPGKRRDDRRSKTMRQASWLMDIEVAATAFAAGLDVATDNRADFERLGELLWGSTPTRLGSPSSTRRSRNGPCSVCVPPGSRGAAAGMV